MKRLIINIDGACSGNPGPASFGVVARDSEGKVVSELKGYIGIATNNIAEYSALIRALEYALERGGVELEIRSDSKLLVEQMNGRYKVKSPNLLGFWQRAVSLTKKIGFVRIVHIPRSQNSEADRLANLALEAPSNIL